MKKLFFAIAFVAISLGLASAQEKNEAVIDINTKHCISTVYNKASESL